MGGMQTFDLYQPAMLAVTLFLAASALTTPDEALAREIYTAIWQDLQLNAVIGNGNWIASLWYNASSGDQSSPDLHIKRLLCQPQGPGYSCSFTLLRDGVVVRVFGEEAPDQLSCKATLIPSDDENGEALEVKHTPPRHGGHSQTTMRCERLDSSAQRQ
jgi:hypothetical protein